MSVHSTSPDFKKNAARALGDAQLQKALGNVKQGFIDKRQKATERLPEFEALRDSARDIKNHTLQHLDLYLEAYEEKVTASGGHVHFARNADGGARHHPVDLPGRGRPDRHQGQIDDLRGNRDQPASRSSTASRRWRPISANTSSSSATRCRAISSRRRCTSTRRRWSRIFAASTPSSIRSATSPNRCNC